MKTVIQELISEFETIQEKHCKTLQERIFFDGVISIIEAKYIEKERQQIEKIAIDMVNIAIYRGVKEGVSMEDEFNKYYDSYFGDSNEAGI